MIIRPDNENRIKVVVVTESPWEIIWDVDLITSITNIPTFTYLYCLLGGEFRPKENANVYWTHACKCPLKNVASSMKKRAIRFCSKTYLKDEIEAVNPKLVVAVGVSALSYFARETGGKRLRGGLRKVFLNQSNGIYNEVRLGSAVFSLAIAPHPSRRNRFWNRPPKEMVKVFKEVIKDIKEKILEK